MARFSSFTEVVDLWPTRDKFAADIGAGIFMARQWPVRDWIPAEWWSTLLKTKTAREAGLTADELLRLAAERRLP
jgi:hypothetical protein